MTAPTTIRPDWPTFQAWQLARAAGDPARRRRLVARWRAIAAWLLREAMRRIMAAIVDRLRPVMDALTAAFRAMATALKPALAAFANLGRALGEVPDARRP